MNNVGGEIGLRHKMNLDLRAWGSVKSRSNFIGESANSRWHHLEFLILTAWLEKLAV